MTVALIALVAIAAMLLAFALGRASRHADDAFAPVFEAQKDRHRHEHVHAYWDPDAVREARHE
jgi:hypothetical protein